jgi:hypothetical protein
MIVRRYPLQKQKQFQSLQQQPVSQWTLPFFLKLILENQREQTKF